MKKVSISGSPRVNVGKKDAQELRRNGRVPCIIYGGTEQIHFSALEKDFKPLVYTPDVNIIQLDIEGKNFESILQEIQFHKVNDNILHVDFLEVIPGKPLVVSLPVKIEGTAAGVKAGGKLNKKLRTLKVRGLVDKLPESVSINVENLEIGQAIKVSEVKLDGIQFLDSPSMTIVSVKTTRSVVEEPKGAAAPAKGAAAPAKVEAPKAEAKK